MRQLKIILFLVALLPLAPTLVLADDGHGASTSTTTLTRNGDRSFPTRPRVPSNQQVCCSYANGILTVTFKYAEGNCEVALTDIGSGIEAFYTIDSEELSATIFVGEVGELFVEISTENGNIYSGTLIP